MMTKGLGPLVVSLVNHELTGLLTGVWVTPTQLYH